jgi:hypothetical protein
MDIMLSMQSTISPAAARESTLVKAIRSRVEPLGGLELQIPPREPMRRRIDPGERRWPNDATGTAESREANCTR